MAALGVVALIYGWIRAILWALGEDRRTRREPEWMRLLDLELERDLQGYLHPSRIAREEENGAA